MSTPTEPHDRDLERDLSDLLRQRALDVTGPPPGPDAVKLHRATAGSGTTSRPRSWLAAGAAAALLAAGAAGVALDRADRETASPLVAGSSDLAVLSDPRASDPVVLDPYSSSDEAVRSFLERTVGPEATDASTMDEMFRIDYETEPVTASRQVRVTFPGAESFAVMTYLSGGSWSVSRSSRELSGSAPLLLQEGDEVELLFAHPSDADHATVWYLDGDGQTREAEIDRVMMDTGHRVAREEVATILEADGFTRSQGLRFADARDMSTIDRARVRVPGTVDLEGQVVLAYFDSEGHPLAVWADRRS